MKIRLLLALFACATFSTSSLRAQAVTEGIGWIASWDQAVAEARQTNKPILLMAGAPACGGVPGVW